MAKFYKLHVIPIRNDDAVVMPGTVLVNAKNMHSIEEINTSVEGGVETSYKLTMANSKEYWLINGEADYKALCKELVKLDV